MKPFFSPLLRALTAHAKNDPVSFHVPGHHYGQALQQELLLDDPTNHPAEWFSSIMRLDVTELSTTDDLHHPEASIMEAQQLAARTFGAEETFFLVGGSTSGNLSLFLAICNPGDIVIVQRNVHKSVINGLKLAGASAVFLSPQIDLHTGLALIPTEGQIEEALIRYPEAKAVFLSNPNYYGMGMSIRPYAELVHRYYKPLIVDEAHGAHYGFHPHLPQSALAAGADAVVQSAHKTLPALTMGAMLHVQGDRVQRDRLRQALAILQSSSPSFPILASLDISRAMIDALGSQLFEQSLTAAASFRKWLDRHSSVIKEMANKENQDTTPFADPLRIVLYDSSDRLSGFELQRWLEKYGCFAEMADPRYTVLIFGINISQKDILKLQQAIIKITCLIEKKAEACASSSAKARTFSDSYTKQRISEPVSFARERFTHTRIRIELDQAEQRIAAEMVVPYPPGIAILYPGEVITSSVIEQIKELSTLGAKFQGAADPSMAKIEVYETN
ncbi:aminotransferase class I/II-fold pyridoxal phosphate-dependent enzyme [Paenibacillus harenae]|uniref:aminotransferase class I/II-fold pyridoxal phosphate-dependent enzyme n=1 Tax=Paenibacillus harenae TaxID=306543 RepID=UPI000409A2E7|nr:aminotransferase class I/II-fold pyridoxal phosphate-dependent enzyme [Paenibacillus harenae]